MWYARIIGGVAVLLLGVATAGAAWLTLPYGGDFGPGPGFVPFWLGLALAVCAIPVIVTECKKGSRSEKLFRPETWKCLQVLGLVVAVLLLLPVLGFSTGLALVTGGGMWIMGRHGWMAYLVTMVGTAVCIHYLFGQWLTIPLPKGVIGW